MKKLSLEELNRDSIEEYKSKEKLPVIILLDNIRSAHNVGAVFRTCDAFAMDRIILAGITARPPHKEINKSAIGATESVDWEFYEDVHECVKQLKEDGHSIIGIEQTDASISLNKFTLADYKLPLVLVFGNEVEGLSESLIPYMDAAIEIDQFGTKHSLNVSVCAGVVLWEIQRQLRHL